MCKLLDLDQGTLAAAGGSLVAVGGSPVVVVGGTLVVVVGGTLAEGDNQQVDSIVAEGGSLMLVPQGRVLLEVDMLGLE